MKQTHNVHRPRFFLKGLCILLLLGMNFLMYSAFFSSVVEDITYDDESYQDARLLELTSEGEYADLYENLNLYELYGDKYDDYWDVTEAWHLYSKYCAAKDAVRMLSADSGADAQAEDYAEQADDLLTQLQEFPADQENQTAQEAIQRIKLSVP